MIVGEDVHDSEKKNPIYDGSKVQNKFKPSVVVFKGLCLLFVWIYPIHAEKLIKERKNRVDDGNEDECMMFEGKAASKSDCSKQIVRNSAHHEASTGVNFYFLSGKQAFDVLD